MTLGEVAHEPFVAGGVGGVERHDVDGEALAGEAFGLCRVGMPAGEHERPRDRRQQLLDDRPPDLARAAEQHDRLWFLKCVLHVSLLRR